MMNTITSEAGAKMELPDSQQLRHDSRGTSGTYDGVVIPTLQYMLSVLLFTRLPWIVGYAGVTNTLLMAFMSLVVSLLTISSMSAICTNGALAKGGIYYIISRSLGLDIGITTGILLYLAQCIGCAVIILASVEVMLYIVPQMHISA